MLSIRTPNINLLARKHQEAILAYIRSGTDSTIRSLKFFDDALKKLFPKETGISLASIIIAKPSELERLKIEFDGSPDNAEFRRTRKKKGMPPPVQHEAFEQFKMLYALLDQDKTLEYDFEETGKHYKGRWSRHSFFEELGLNTCPYCNRNDIQIVHDRGSGEYWLSGELDHWITKANYPIFSVSFFNLIPSCKVCNKLKNASKKVHANPYDRDFNLADEIRIEFRTLTSRFPRTLDSFQIDFGFSADVDSVAERKDKCVELVRVFRLLQQYEKHLDFVQEVIHRHYLFNDSFRDELFRKYHGTLFGSKEDVFRTAFGRYEDDLQLHRRPLSKLTKDIQDQLAGRMPLLTTMDRDELIRLEMEIEEIHKDLPLWRKLCELFKWVK